MRQLQSYSEQIDLKNLDDRTHILIYTEDFQIFRAEIPNGSLKLSEIDDSVLNNVVGKRIPDNHLFPLWRDTVTEAQQSLSPDEFYVKKHYNALSCYDGTPYATELFMGEVEILEIISKRPHQNVNKYLGCIRNGDYIGGICLQKCNCTLNDLVKGKIPADRAPPFQPDIIISGIKTGLDHIHSFGLVHNDINPHNIMVDDAGNPIIIDFDSCVAVGAPCRGGTLGWSKRPKVAAFENDTHGFELVAKFVRGEYDGMDFNFDDDDDENLDDAPK